MKKTLTPHKILICTLLAFGLFYCMPAVEAGLGGKVGEGFRPPGEGTEQTEDFDTSGFGQNVTPTLNTGGLINAELGGIVVGGDGGGGEGDGEGGGIGGGDGGGIVDNISPRRGFLRVADPRKAR